MRPRQPAILAAVAVFAAGCANYIPTLPVISPYRMDIQQGNYVTQDMVAKLKPGMTRSQVRFVLGTPLLTDVFHGDRWDYVYRFEKAGTLTEQRRIVAVFSGDQLLRIEGDVVPAPAAAAKPAAAEKPAATPAAPAPAETK